jgi:hypothetical protein
MQNVTAHGRSAKDHFELVIRLQQSRSSPPSDATLRLRAQALVKDILMSRLEVEAEIHAPDYVRTRGLNDLGKALAASRALQAAFEGFRTAAPAARSNISVVLDSSAQDETSSFHAGPSVEQKDLLDSAKPSQVLITQAFYDRVAQYQPALRSSSLRAGVYEFLWTDEQRLEQLQAEAEFMPTLVSDWVRPSVIPDPVVKSVEPVQGPRHREPDRLPVREAKPVLDDDVSTKWLTAPQALAVGSAAVILITIGYLVHSRVLVGNQAKPIPQSPSETVQPTPPAPTPPQITTPQGATQEAKPPSQVIATPPDNLPPPKTKPSRVPSIPPIKGDTASATDTPTRTRGCSIAGEIPDYLRLAEHNNSQGKYDSAISEYNLVLACEPGNRQARDGLKNAEDAEKYSH